MERRAVDRLDVSGAHVTYKKVKKIKGVDVQIFDRFSRPYPLKNFTKSGICFEVDKKLSFGERIQLEIIIPGQKSLRLEGHVRWFKNSGHNGSGEAGAQFLAFGKSRECNSLKTLDDLRNIYHQLNPQSQNT